MRRPLGQGRPPAQTRRDHERTVARAVRESGRVLRSAGELNPQQTGPFDTAAVAVVEEDGTILNGWILGVTPLGEGYLMERYY